MSLCGVCQTVIVTSDLPVTCIGNCKRTLHQRCSSLSKTAAKLVTENANVLFKCKECEIEQSDDLLRDQLRDLVSHVQRMDEEMKKLSSLSDSIKAMRDDTQRALKIGIEELGRNVNGSIDKLICEKFEKFEKTFFEINAREILAAKNDSNSTSRSIHSESDLIQPKSKKRKFQKDEETDDDVFGTQSFSDVVKRKKGSSKSSKTGNSNAPANRKARPVIVIKPKESNQPCDDTRKFLKTQLDPKTNKVSNFRNGKDGSIIVECATGDNVTEVMNGIKSKLGENYSAVVPTSVPRLKVMGLSDQYPSDEFIDLLKSQNDDIAIDNVKVIDAFENPRFTYNKYTVVIEVDVDTYKCMLTAKKVNIGFDRCLVLPAIRVLRCYKCGEFGHRSTDCKNGERCSNCSQPHKTSDCTSTVLKCVNCMKMNSERKTKLDIRHAASSSECLVYRDLYEKRKSSLRFNK